MYYSHEFSHPHFVIMGSNYNKYKIFENLKLYVAVYVTNKI